MKAKVTAVLLAAAAMLPAAHGRPQPEPPLPQQQAAPPLFDDAGYRMARYRAPVAQAPPGTERIALDAAIALHDAGGTLFIDLMPAEGGVRDPASGRWRLAEVRRSIPGAHWFPEAGRGNPDPAIAAGFDSGVARLTGGRRDRPIVVFCLADCWMSWNAALRLARAGHRRVYWLAEGTDGWAERGLPLVAATPEGGIISASSSRR